MIKKVVVGTEAIQIAQSKGIAPFTLLVYNNSASTIYLLSDPTEPITEGIPILAGASYGNDYAKGNYYLLAESAGLDARVEVN